MTEWEDYSFVVRGSQRRKILCLMDSPKTPTQLKNESKLALTNVSRTLVAFNENGLVKCLTPKQKVGRFYSLTKRGKKVKTLLESSTGN